MFQGDKGKIRVYIRYRVIIQSLYSRSGVTFGHLYNICKTSLHPLFSGVTPEFARSDRGICFIYLLPGDRWECGVGGGLLNNPLRPFSCVSGGELVSTGMTECREITWVEMGVVYRVGKIIKFFPICLK